MLGFFVLEGEACSQVMFLLASIGMQRSGNTPLAEKISIQLCDLLIGDSIISRLISIGAR